MTFGYAIDELFGSLERPSVQSVQKLRFWLKYPTAVEVESTKRGSVFARPSLYLRD